MRWPTLTLPWPHPTTNLALLPSHTHKKNTATPGTMQPASHLATRTLMPEVGPHWRALGVVSAHCTLAGPGSVAVRCCLAPGQIIRTACSKVLKKLTCNKPVTFHGPRRSITVFTRAAWLQSTPRTDSFWSILILSSNLRQSLPSVTLSSGFPEVFFTPHYGLWRNHGASSVTIA